MAMAHDLAFILYQLTTRTPHMHRAEFGNQILNGRLSTTKRALLQANFLFLQLSANLNVAYSPEDFCESVSGLCRAYVQQINNLCVCATPYYTKKSARIKSLPGRFTDRSVVYLVQFYLKFRVGSPPLVLIYINISTSASIV